MFQATFIAMSTSDGDVACDTGTIIDDAVLEGEHSFEIEIASTDPQLTNISPASAIVTIQDNDGMYCCCAVVMMTLKFYVNFLILCRFDMHFLCYLQMQQSH